ncbi:transporter substrate-binding domain-containing protein [Roseateles asaccharophilus]|uniref:Polar amino acid transport system substrate-binding protein n=1 Tax=Roseateles asaccharophilus TaxID=582607 RepID=A0ABU2AEB3_9BURK|nr:transporter substrate-binding domain-containing protein [Roseateles asaccharophilus]MDR7334338.1 polar amino acid transport system substrate-binding protein [Roseateles asaccharophilus]
MTQAGCSRDLQVPVAAIGMAVTVKGGEIGGIYPELLRSEGTKTGCAVAFQVVPRARQELLFETGQSDMLVPARRSARRDLHGTFVPIIRSRAVLLSMRTRQLPATSVADLLRHRELRVAVVRGYDYDGSYQSLVKQLRTEGRLIESADPVSLARDLDAGIADVAVVTPTAVTGALRSDPKLSGWVERLQVQPAPELAWGESGAYVSRRSSLSEADRQRALQMLEGIGRSGDAWRAFQRYHPDENLNESVRPR